MAKKHTNRNVAGVLHYVTGNVDRRRPIFRQDSNCIAFLEELQSLRKNVESLLIAFVVMLDHFHLIVNPRDGDIQNWIGELKSVSARRLVEINPPGMFRKNGKRIRLAGEFQNYASLERLDDLAKDQLHPQQSTQSGTGRNCA